ncbi:MAG: hypothetical protein PHG25_03320 [Candidatus Pacebacteria bacterium]|nr:hypothetical protein [Candidatus Paceibacterota bacterium]
MKTYLSALIALVVLFIAHILGNTFDLYTHINGYDIPMHILGGVGIGFSIIAVLRSCTFKIDNYYWVGVLLVFIGGFLWELFEAYYGIAGAPVGTKAYYIDTIKDLFDDTLGGLIVVYVEKARIK